ncbi:MAG: motility associated factor glycosyltransferase family protein [Acidobacteria bacterium]|nr:motility associated factor glycosyltransferase family protein [Acidobacteriota bacterium]
MNHFASNVSLLSKRQPELARMLQDIEYKRVRVFESVRGGPTASYKKGESELSLHSRYEPMKEARQTLGKTDCSNSDYFIFLGFGLGYILDALIEKHPDPRNHYFVVESDLEILKAAFEARDLSKILLLPHLHFAWPAKGPELAEQWMRFFDPVEARKSTYLTHLPSASLNPDAFKSAAEIIQSQTFQIFSDINTLVEKSRTFLDNFVRNVRKAALAPGVIKFSGKFTDVPAVIVSAGPSLDKNIHELRGYEDCVLILSTDTALKPLLTAGIRPHFILTGDPFLLNYRHMEGVSIGDSLVVAETTSYPEVFNQFENRIVACTYENSSLRSLSDLIGNKGILRAWGSVATMALDFALLLKCNPVIFLGQDLAHSGGSIYCSGLHFDEEWYGDIQDPVSWLQQLENMRSSRRTVLSEDIFGRPIETTDKLTAYWNWMLKEVKENPEVCFINATEGGILKGGMEIVSMKEAIYRHCSKPLHLYDRIHNIFADAQKDSLHYTGMDISLLVAEASTIRNILTDGSRLCSPKIKLPVQDLSRKLEGAKENLYCNTHVAPLLDCLNQMGNVTFLRKRKEWSKHPKNEASIKDLQYIYAEYFTTVRQALDIIEDSLKKIKKNLSLS